MVHPVLTILFDLFIVGSALAILGALVAEQYALRQPAIGRAVRPRVAPRAVTVGGQRRPRRGVRMPAA
jgi:hypothetical protein